MPDASTDRRESPQSSQGDTAAAVRASTRGLPKRLRKTHTTQDETQPAAVSRRSAARLERSLELARRCAGILDENRANEIVVLDLRGVTALVDFFVIGTAASRRQAVAMASDIDAEMKRESETKLGIEGVEDGRWVLLDYGDFVVHIFSEDARATYALEELWGDAERVPWAGSPELRPRVSEKA
jgi:ribosome-associated protein